ncbi:MAG: alpha/beta hydrolase family protein, partial [Verrucomicrobiota bacterium]
LIVVGGGQLPILSQEQLKGTSQEHPDAVSDKRTLSRRVLPLADSGLLLEKYYARRSQQKAVALHAKKPPAQFLELQSQLRSALEETFLMPPAARKPQATLLGAAAVDGIQVEKQLLKIRDGVYSPALIWRPMKDARARKSPAILMLPGHGDPSWSPAVQSRCLSFAKRGYVVMLVQPFGQAERGEKANSNEGHDTQATAFLLTVGQSMLGLIMSDHRAELDYLAARPDVDAQKLGVTGVSMGGTHSVWLAAIEPRIKAAVGVAVAPIYAPRIGIYHHGQCDLMAGAYNVADMGMIQSLCAPRALMTIYPDTNLLFTDEGARLFIEGRINVDAALQKYAMNEAQLGEFHRYEHETYTLAQAPKNYRDVIVQGPHDYTPPMREIAAGWFARHLKNEGDGTTPLPEPALSPITDRAAAIAAFSFWPDGNRPPEILAPTQYVEREIKAAQAKLPPAPASNAIWQKLRAKLQADVARRLGVSLLSSGAAREVGTVSETDATIHRLIVTPEVGIEVPALLFEPTKAGKYARLVVLLDAGGMAATSDSPERKKLSQDGDWALCLDVRGIGETRSAVEQSSYLGWRDYDIAVAALKLGETLAGYWSKDLLTTIGAAQKYSGNTARVVVRGEKEMGLVAILAAGQSSAIDEVEAHGLLASYFSPPGYGLPFAYSDEKGAQSVRSRALGGYGSMVPLIPNILKSADIAQLAALVAPRPLNITAPLWGSGGAVSPAEAQNAFAWTQQAYRANGAANEFHLAP